MKASQSVGARATGQRTLRDDSQEPGPGDVVVGRYAIRRVIGRGGMGVVHEARHTVTGKRVALKWLLFQRSDGAVGVHRILREARAAARVDHPNVVAIYDVSEHNGIPFLVMEYLDGAPLSAVLDGPPIDYVRLLATLLPVLDALAMAHEHGVVHRDLKPSNIFLCTNERGRPRHAVLLDFGISKFLELKGAGDSVTDLHDVHDADERTLTDTGCILGTPHYMAPEQLDDARDVDPRADVYAFGVLLYRALGGALPFEADSYSALLLRITSGTPRPISMLRPDLPSGLARIIMRAMSRRRKDRFADARALLTELKAFAGGSGHTSHDSTWGDALRSQNVPQPARSRRASPWWAVVLVLVPLGTLLGAVLSQRSFGPSERVANEAPPALPPPEEPSALSLPAPQAAECAPVSLRPEAQLPAPVVDDVHPPETSSTQPKSSPEPPESAKSPRPSRTRRAPSDRPLDPLQLTPEQF